MNSLPRIWMPGKFVILRHTASIILLFSAWKILGRWYTFQHPYDYLIFVSLACTGFLLAAAPFLVKEIRNIPRSRILVCLPLLALCLPWGEWLSLGTIFTRESWSEMLFKQGLFLYATIAILRILPSFASAIHIRFLKVLEFASHRRFFLWAAPIFMFLLTGWIAFFVYQETPVVPDSAAHLFQAHVLSNFKLYAPAPIPQESFTGPLDLLVMKDGKWFGMYSPGFAALMAPAVLVDLEWLVSPLLGTLTCAVWILYAVRWHNRRAAILLGWLFTLSPFLVVMSSTVMVFTPELFFASATIYLLRLSLEQPDLSILTGLFLGIAGGILVRSFSLLPFLFPVLAYTSLQALRKRLIRIPLTIFCSFAAGVAILFLYQWKAAGDPFVPPYQLELPVAMGFKEHFVGTHTPLKAIDNLSNNLLGLNHWVGGWYSGSLLFVIAFLWRQKLQVWDKLFIAGCCFLMAFYFFFFFQDLFFGPRFFYSFTPILLLFIVRSVTEESIASKFSGEILIPLLVLTLVISVPKALPAFVKRYDPSKTQAGKLKEEIRKTGEKPTLVFLDKNVGQNFVNWNDPFLKSGIILARDLEEYNLEVQKLFPKHQPVWFRMTFGFEKGKITSGFKFAEEPDRTPSGTLSLFELAMAIQAAREYPKQDFFDICYIDLFNAGSARKNYEFLEHAEEAPLHGREYKRIFRKGVVHAGKMLLLPKIAFEERGHKWSLGFDSSHFRNEFNDAHNAFIKAGDIGRTIQGQFDKVKRRIDRNSDQHLSDSEIHVFLVEKIKLLSGGASL